MSGLTGEPTGSEHHGREQQPAAHASLTIHELAGVVGMTPRNIRAHQSRGLVHPPTMHGRTGYYDGTHVSRLVLIKELQDSGLNLRAIGAALKGNDPLSAVLRALRSARRSTDLPSRVMLPEFSVQRLREVDPSTPDELCENDLLERGPDGSYTADAVQFAAGARLFEAGMSVEGMVRLQLEVVRLARRVAGEVVRAFLEHGEGDGDQERQALENLAPYAVQLFTTAFEQTVESALREKPDDEGVTPPRR